MQKHLTTDTSVRSEQVPASKKHVSTTSLRRSGSMTGRKAGAEDARGKGAHQASACAGSLATPSSSPPTIRMLSGRSGAGLSPGKPGSRAQRDRCSERRTLAVSCANGQISSARCS